jgi:hypothetical protein
MRNILGLIVGFYFTVALAVFGGAAYGFLSGEHAKHSTCQPSWAWAVYRAAVWPKAYYDDTDKVGDIPDWLLVRYKPFGDACR